MLTPQFNLPIHAELVIDLFAGGGGASTGIEQAIGRAVDIAINHDPEAISLHQANHPQTRHFVSDVFEVDPVKVTDGRPVGLLWASPDCKHFSKAKGGQPVSKKIRSLAWVVCKWAKAVRPRVICLENVEEFQTWGPLGADNRPCPERKGKTFKRWVGSLRGMGYAVEWRELRACDFGAPTIRKRLFLVARCDGMPIVWPAASHGAPTSLPVKAKKLKPWRTAAECIDWSIPAPSIFDRKKPLAEATCRRIAKGIMRYVVEAAEPFIVGLAHGEHTQRAGSRSHGIDEPVRTIHAGGGNHALCVPTLIQTGYGEREGQAPRALDLHKPIGTLVGSQKHALVSAFLAKHYTGVVGSDMADPVATVTSVDHHSLVTTKLEPLHGSNGSSARADSLKSYRGSSGRDGLEVAQSELHAVDGASQAGDKSQSGVFGGSGKPKRARVHDAGTSPGMDGSTWGDSAGPHDKSQGWEQDQQSPAQFGGGEPSGKQPALVSSLEKAKSAKHSGDHSSACGNSVEGASRQGVDVSGDCESIGHIPNNRIQSHADSVKGFLIAYYGVDQDPGLREPMHTVTTRDRFGLVTIHGTEYAIVDIGLRMLTPRELYRAQGFPESYAIDFGADGRPLTKTAQVRMCGNSVCPPMSKAIVGANYSESDALRVAA